MRYQVRTSTLRIESPDGAAVPGRDSVPATSRSLRTMLKLLAFACSPILLLAVSAVAGLALLFVLARLVGAVGPAGAQLGSFGRSILPVLLPVLTIVVPAVILTVAYCLLARYLGIGRGWALASCLVLSALAGLAICDVKLSDMPGQNQLILGLGFGAGQLWRLAQALPPLLLGLWLLRRGRDRGWTPASRETRRLAA